MAGKKEYDYVVVIPKYGETFDDGDKFESNFSSEPHELDSVVEEYADYFHGNRDGWESSWPVEFWIYDTDGKLLGKFDVEREAVPEFNAILKEAEPVGQGGNG